MNRKSTTGTLKLLVDADALLSAINRLTGCGALLLRNAAGSPELTAVCYLLEAITDDLYEEVRASVDAEEEARKRSRQRT